MGSTYQKVGSRAGLTDKQVSRRNRTGWQRRRYRERPAIDEGEHRAALQTFIAFSAATLA